MKATLQVLQIDAVVEYTRALPYYYDCECVQKLAVFIDGEREVEKELARLESFRRAIIRLAEEGLARPADCQPTDPPFVSIELAAGEAFKSPMHEFHMSLGLERFEDVEIWVLRFRNGNGEPRGPVFDDPAHALEIAKSIIDRETAGWATQVAFHPAPRA
jgi:hypothetical protein